MSYGNQYQSNPYNQAPSAEAGHGQQVSFYPPYPNSTRRDNIQALAAAMAVLGIRVVWERKQARFRTNRGIARSSTNCNNMASPTHSNRRPQ